jgi:hypothetical protein
MDWLGPTDIGRRIQHIPTGTTGMVRRKSYTEDTPKMVFPAGSVGVYYRPIDEYRFLDEGSQAKPSKFSYHARLAPIANDDVSRLVEKDLSYGASWKKSGGRSAWFMLLRKMDRLMEIMRRPSPPHGWSTLECQELIDHGEVNGGEITIDASLAQYLLDDHLSEDIFLKIEDNPRGEDGSALAEIRDLRRYLLLVEAEMVERGVVDPPLGAVQREASKEPAPGSRCEWAPGLDGLGEDEVVPVQRQKDPNIPF